MAYPRIARPKKHNLLASHLLALSTVISADEDWEGFADFRYLKLDRLKQYRSFKTGILESEILKDKIVV